MIRDAEEGDLDALFTLLNEVQAVHAKALSQIFRDDLDAEAAKGMFRETLGKRGHTILVAEDAGQAVGYIWFEIFDRPANFYHHPRRAGYIHHISVSASVRRQGVGRALVEAVRSRLTHAGISEVGVDYWAFNTRASQFFASLGFEPQRHIASAPVTPPDPEGPR
jgi:ribosomal protein S18 acetylase RimI-like enzyme